MISIFGRIAERLARVRAEPGRSAALPGGVALSAETEIERVADDGWRDMGIPSAAPNARGDL